MDAPCFHAPALFDRDLPTGFANHRPTGAMRVYLPALGLHGGFSYRQLHACFLSGGSSCATVNLHGTTTVKLELTDPKVMALVE